MTGQSLTRGAERIVSRLRQRTGGHQRREENRQQDEKFRHTRHFQDVRRGCGKLPAAKRVADPPMSCAAGQPQPGGRGPRPLERPDQHLLIPIIAAANGLGHPEHKTEDSGQER